MTAARTGTPTRQTVTSQVGGSQSYRAPGIKSATRKGSLDGQGFALLKQAQFNDEGKKIGMFNATHKHGEPIKRLLAILKARRAKPRKPKGPQYSFGGPSGPR